MGCEPRKPRRPRCMAASYGVIPSLERAQEAPARRNSRRPGMMTIFSRAVCIRRASWKRTLT
eukprot:11934312-Heterocapsa_arctica.AAC.1